MLNIESEMNRVILFFTIKHKGNWEKAYNAIKNKENITLTEINSIKGKYLDNYISIIDKDYPDNFKQIYMPPLSIFAVGNKNLLQNQDLICSIWSSSEYQGLDKENLDKSKVYAILYSKPITDTINLLTAQGYKFIVINHNYSDDHEIHKLDLNGNLLHLSEIPFEIDCPDIDKHQNCERLLLGVSKYAWALDINKDFVSDIYPLFEFEKRTLYTSEANLAGLDKCIYLKGVNLKQVKK